MGLFLMILTSLHIPTFVRHNQFGFQPKLFSRDIVMPSAKRLFFLLLVVVPIAAWFIVNARKSHRTRFQQWHGSAGMKDVWLYR